MLMLAALRWVSRMMQRSRYGEMRTMFEAEKEMIKGFQERLVVLRGHL